MSELEALRDQAARIAAVRAYPGRGPLMRTARRITDEAYALGRADAGRELADLLRGLIEDGILGPGEITARILAALGPLIPDPDPRSHARRLEGAIPALSDDDSEAEADAAEQRARFQGILTDHNLGYSGLVPRNPGDYP